MMYGKALRKLGNTEIAKTSRGLFLGPTRGLTFNPQMQESTY